MDANHDEGIETASERPAGLPLWLFGDRAEAGERLATRLARYRDQQPIVLALPRGGVPVAAPIARVLHAPLDVFPVRKVGAPEQRELGIGAIALGGTAVLNHAALAELGIARADLDRVIAEELAELERQRRQFRDERPLPDVRDRTVILVDDGLATGVSALAAIRALRKLHPRQIVLAIPVCARETLAALRPEVDDAVCLEQPEPFLAVGLWYRDFRPTSDETVITLLDQARERERRNGDESRPPGEER